MYILSLKKCFKKGFLIFFPKRISYENIYQLIWYVCRINILNYNLCNTLQHNSFWDYIKKIKTDSLLIANRKFVMTFPWAEQ